MAKRAGGRQARKALRAAPLAEDIKPVHAGEAGGQYQPLSERDIAAIMRNIYRILDEVGFGDATPHCVETCTAYGAVMGNDGRLRMPRDVVDKALADCQRNLVLHGQDPKHDLQISGSKVHFATAGAAVMIADVETNSYRDSLAQDLYDLARITDTCEHIHMFQRMCVLRDVLDPYELDVNTLYLSVMGTTKHVGSSWVHAGHVEKTLPMLHMIAGSESAWRARPFVSQSNCFVVPPMKFAEDALGCLRAAVEGGMPVLLLSAGQAGATTPACLAGAVSQAWAECLGGLVYVNAIEPGAPAIIGCWPFVSDLRTGAMSGGSPEQALLSAGCAQMGLHLDLPFGTGCGMSDSKLPDFQAGAERAYTTVAAALSGANIVYESAGMYASLLSACPESLLLDNDVLGAALRITRGIEVNEETLSFDNIRDVCTGGEGHYLGSGQTLKVMQSEYIYPDFSDRDSPNIWKEKNKPVLVEKATQKKHEILKSHYPKHISDDIDMRIRDRFPIFVTREAVGRA
ncbi:MAG: trimethylamine methyltransferase family protein [Gammaproteobacteria bacterium]|nr:trimethylamine methyltransferase family protein [Gammaproteobacteria bacterium]